MLENSRQTAPNSDLCIAEAVDPSSESDALDRVAKPDEPSPRGDADAQSNVGKDMNVENGAQTRRKKPRRIIIGSEVPEVEILDIPSGPPSWKDPETIVPLLESDDKREAHFVEALIHREYEFYVHLERSVKSRDADEAVREFRVVDNVCRALIQTAENLAEHRYGGVQSMSVLEFSGPTIALGNKIQQLKQPKPGSPAANLVKRLYYIERDLDDVASRFGGKSRIMLDRIDEYRTSLKPKQWFRDAESWENLRAKALKLMGALSAVVNTLERGHRQVVIKTPAILNTDCEGIRDRGFPLDTESNYVDAKSRPREPVAN